jgi:ribosomal protein L40E
MKFLKPLLEITKLDKEKNKSIRKNNWGTEHSKGNKTVPAKVAKICTEDGHRLPKQALRCRPKGRRNLGRPRKRWTD